MSTLMGKPAPQFKAKAVQIDRILEDFSLNDFHGKYVLFFFYPLDFTFVCPTELHAFQERLADFEKRNAQVVACSVDSWYSHFAWLSVPKNKGGIQGVEYPIVSDLNKSIAKDYGVLKEDDGIAFRGLYLIDKQGVIRHQLINDLPLGRSVDEAIRMLDALIFHEKHGEVCPANWNNGDKAMEPTQEGLKNYYN
ncbi:thioredoxin peroxidase [Candidatus Aerophobetes bacterium]|uniref:Thioredoxin peroxidase n=1 Tax=Aerophobetes bacterium TaxID=2030807 RepID=A0A2A4YKT8_UNCAE|nr:MAG: thioredoxin peroxidase [Candidatus Aerophobetes bacterium]